MGLSNNVHGIQGGLFMWAINKIGHETLIDGWFSISSPAAKSNNCSGFKTWITLTKTFSKKAKWRIQLRREEGVGANPGGVNRRCSSKLAFEMSKKGFWRNKAGKCSVWSPPAPERHNNQPVADFAVHNHQNAFSSDAWWDSGTSRWSFLCRSSSLLKACWVIWPTCCSHSSHSIIPTSSCYLLMLSLTRNPPHPSYPHSTQWRGL